MPSSPSYKRKYKQEYAQKGQSGTKGKKDRAARNKARAAAVKKGTVKKGDGKDVGHTKPMKNGGRNSKTKVQSKSTNRSHGGKIGSKAGKAAGARKANASKPKRKPTPKIKLPRPPKPKPKRITTKRKK